MHEKNLCECLPHTLDPRKPYLNRRGAIVLNFEDDFIYLNEIRLSQKNMKRTNLKLSLRTCVVLLKLILKCTIFIPIWLTYSTLPLCKSEGISFTANDQLFPVSKI